MSDTLTDTRNNGATLPAASLAAASVAPAIESHGAAASRLSRDAFINIVPIEQKQPTAAELVPLANTMIEPMQDPPAVTVFDNVAIPAGYTYFSQFVDHDLTGQNQNALIKRPTNNRSAVLDLDSIYGTDTIDTLIGDLLIPIDPQFESIYMDDGVHFRLEKTATGADDLPRSFDANGRNEPIVSDGRNDENMIVSQIDLAFLKFHNRVADEIAAARPELTRRQVFSIAYSTVVQHYQWIVMNDFLPRLIAGKDIAAGRAYVATVRGSTDRKYTKADVSRGMPAEFSVAAYRMGHSMVRFNYGLNDLVKDGDPIPERKIFDDANPTEDLHGHREYPENAIIAFHRFLDFKSDAPQAGDPDFDVPQFSMLLDTGLSAGLSMLPAFSFQDKNAPAVSQIEHVLAYRNLVKGTIFQLPSGQTVAKYYGIPPQKIDILAKTTLADPMDKNSDFKYGDVDAALTARFGNDTPLWYYILAEARDPAGPAGAHLGPLGKRIVTECFIAFLAATPISIFDTGFSPQAGQFGCTTTGTYTLAHLIRYATRQ